MSDRGKPQIPFREDGMADLNNWKSFVEMNGYETLDDLISETESHLSNTAAGILLRKAVSAKENEIATGFVKALCNERLSTQEAISILKMAEHQILTSKFIC